MTWADEENAPVYSLLADARLQRLLNLGQEIDAFRSKMSVATSYIGRTGSTGDTAFFLYKCKECGNAWLIRRFSMQIGSPVQ